LHIHDRMPLHLPPDAWEDWLDREQVDGAEAKALLASVAEGPALRHREVSMRVNSIRNNDATLLD
jgi:putative SOS response-associated peptidase YedK